MARRRRRDEDGEDEGPLRTCILTRERRDRERLIRFVLSPEGEVVPDIAARLPGRGLWLTTSRRVVAEAALLPVAQEALALSGRDRDIVLRGVLDGGGSAPEGWEAYEAWAAHGDATPVDVPVADDDVLQLMYTSGTESRPKGVMMTSRSLVTQYVSCIVDGRYSPDDVALHALDVRPRDALQAELPARAPAAGLDERRERGVEERDHRRGVDAHARLAVVVPRPDVRGLAERAREAAFPARGRDHRDARDGRAAGGLREHACGVRGWGGGRPVVGVRGDHAVVGYGRRDVD